MTIPKRIGALYAEYEKAGRLFERAVTRFLRASEALSAHGGILWGTPANAKRRLAKLRKAS